MTKSSYGTIAASGMVHMGFAQAVRIVLTTCTTIIVARLLSPDDYGVVAMAAPITAFLLLFRDMGLSQAAIQARNLSHDQSNALFWINVLAAGAITIALLALSPVVGWFYGDSRPGYITAASATTVLISATAIQHTALLNRDLRFRQLGKISIISAVVTLVATVMAALVLRNYWAIWIGALASTLCSNALVWHASSWRPSKRPTFRGAGKMIRFGASVTGFNLLNFLSRNLDNVLIGKLWGTAALGLYDRSYRLMMFPLKSVNAPLGRVVFPLLSRLQEEPERFRRSYLLITRAIMLASIPAIVVAVATSDRLIPFLLGEQWSEAAPIFFWLSLAALLQPISNAAGWLFTALGRGGALLKWGLFSSSVLVASFVVGVQWGAVGVAIAYFCAVAALVPLLFYWASKGSPVRMADFYRVCGPSFTAAWASWATVVWLSKHLTIGVLLLASLALSYILAILAHWVAARRDLAAMANIVLGSLSRFPWARRLRRANLDIR